MGIVPFRRLARRTTDQLSDTFMLARLWLFDMIYGPESMTPADERREVERARLRKAFPKVDTDGTGPLDTHR